MYTGRGLPKQNSAVEKKAVKDDSALSQRTYISLFLPHRLSSTSQVWTLTSMCCAFCSAFLASGPVFFGTHWIVEAMFFKFQTTTGCMTGRHTW
jgi:hypothetical protein